jgi:hypothetical protein
MREERERKQIANLLENLTGMPWQVDNVDSDLILRIKEKDEKAGASLLF